MKITIYSDVHNEFDRLIAPIEKDEDILILAGDIGVIKHKDTILPFVTEMSNRFNHVFYVMGNHEHYKSNFPTSFDKLSTLLHGLENVYLLDNSSKSIDDVLFIGSTMWSDYADQNTMVMQKAQFEMNDHKLIRTGPKSTPWKQKFSPMHAVKEYKRSVRFIFDEIKKHKDEFKKIVVITHHAPSWRSIPPIYQTSKLNGAYVTELSEQIKELKPSIWIHGHLHNSSDYMIGDTRVISNPRGYVPQEPNNEFDPNFNVII